MDDFEKRWQRIQELLSYEISGKEPRAMSSGKTLFGIRSTAEETLDRIAREIEEEQRQQRVAARKAARAEALECAQREAEEAGLELRAEPYGLVLVGNGMELHLDFADDKARLAPSNLPRELLVRAAKVKRTDGRAPTAIDATAGLGQDALLLAAAGFTVTLYERDVVIAALLRDALSRAAKSPDLAAIVRRMTLVDGDSIAALHALANASASARPDIVYLDPMFPERRKSAAVKKKFQLLHRLERPCDNEEELLAAATAAHPKKIVIKRPPHAPNLAGVKPSYSLTGKAVRYDCIVLPPLQQRPSDGA